MTDSAQKPNIVFTILDEWGPRIRNWWPVIGVLAVVLWWAAVRTWGFVVSFPESAVQAAVTFVVMTMPQLLIWRLKQSSLMEIDTGIEGVERLAEAILRAMKDFVISTCVLLLVLCVSATGLSFAVSRAFSIWDSTNILKCVPWVALLFCTTLSIGLICVVPIAIALKLFHQSIDRDSTILKMLNGLADSHIALVGKKDGEMSSVVVDRFDTD